MKEGHSSDFCVVVSKFATGKLFNNTSSLNISIAKVSLIMSLLLVNSLAFVAPMVKVNPTNKLETYSQHYQIFLISGVSGETCHIGERQSPIDIVSKDARYQEFRPFTVSGHETLSIGKGTLTAKNTGKKAISCMTCQSSIF